MNKENERLIIEIVKRFKDSKSEPLAENSIELLIATITFVSNLRPNLTIDNPLSISEMLCLIFMSIGYNPDKCAELLGISVTSVTTYEQRMRKKLGAKNRTNALYLAQLRGYISIAA